MPPRFTITLSLLAVCALGAGVSACTNKEEAGAYARERAAEADREARAKRGEGGAVVVATALPSDVDLACDALLPIDQLTEMLEEKEPVTLVDLTEKNPDSTSTCSIRRGGEPLDSKTQQRIAEKSGRLGVMGGDELCNMTLYCSLPADEEGLKERCESEDSLGNHTLGVFSCVKVTQKGEDDGYTYKLIDEDSKCTVVMRGGPSVIEEAQVQACARAAMKLLTPAALEAAR